MNLTFEMNADNIPESGRAILEIDPTPQGYSVITKYLDSMGETRRQDCTIVVLHGKPVGATPGEVT